MLRLNVPRSFRDNNNADAIELGAISSSFGKNTISTARGDFLSTRELDNYPERTDDKCWWCFHNFDGRPIGIPKKFDPVRETFHVFGCFCGFPCALAAIASDEFKRFNVNCEKTAPLLNVMFLRSVKTKTINLADKLVTKAPPRYSLRIFGGNMSIEEFRNASRTQVDYDASMLPLVPVQVFCAKKVNSHEIRMAGDEPNKQARKSDAPNDGAKKKRTGPHRISLINTF